MSTHHSDITPTAKLDRMLARMGVIDAQLPTEPVVAYVGLGRARLRARAESLSSGWTKRRAWKRFAFRQSRGRKSFSTRARRQSLREIEAIDALPIARRARAGGLHGVALRAYVSAVAALDGVKALFE